MDKSQSNNRKSQRKSQVRGEKRTPKALAFVSPKGPMLFVPDVLALIRHKKSAWWVRNKFAHELRFKVGRSPAWWEQDVLAWLGKQGEK